MPTAIPIVEVADNAHLARIRRPYREGGTGDAINRCDMRAELFERPEMRALHEQMDIQFAQHLAEAIRVLDVVTLFAAVREDSEPVAERLLTTGDRAGEKPLLANLR